MEIVLFGEGGVSIRVEAGDVLVLPAGVSHCMAGSSDTIQMVGGYPEGRDWDNVQQALLDKDSHREAAKRIMMLPVPGRDPATGEPMRHWIDAPSSVDAGLNDYRDALG